MGWKIWKAKIEALRDALEKLGRQCRQKNVLRPSLIETCYRYIWSMSQMKTSQVENVLSFFAGAPIDGKWWGLVDFVRRHFKKWILMPDHFNSHHITPLFLEPFVEALEALPTVLQLWYFDIFWHMRGQFSRNPHDSAPPGKSRTSRILKWPWTRRTRPLIITITQFFLQNSQLACLFPVNIISVGSRFLLIGWRALSFMWRFWKSSFNALRSVSQGTAAHMVHLQKLRFVWLQELKRENGLLKERLESLVCSLPHKWGAS